MKEEEEEEEEGRRMRKRMARKREEYGKRRGSNSLGGRREALLGLTQHRRLKSIGTLGGTHHLDSLDSGFPPFKLIKTHWPRVELVRLAGWQAFCRQPRRERDV